MNTKRIIIMIAATLGIFLGCAASASAAYENLDAGIKVESYPNPCPAGSCEIVIRDNSFNPDNESYTFEVDCRNEAHYPGFVADSGSTPLPAGSTFTCRYLDAADAGYHQIVIRIVQNGSTASTSVQVAPAGNGPGTIELRSPTSVALPHTFEFVTSKASADFTCSSQQGPCEATQVRVTQQGGLYHRFVQVPLAPVDGPSADDDLVLRVRAYNGDPQFSDTKQFLVHVEKNGLDPFGLNPELPPYWSFLKKGKKCFVSRTFGYYSTQPSRWELKFKVKTKGKKVKPYTTNGTGGGSNFQELASANLDSFQFKVTKKSLPATIKVKESVTGSGTKLYSNSAKKRLKSLGKCKSKTPQAASVFGP